MPEARRVQGSQCWSRCFNHSSSSFLQFLDYVDLFFVYVGCCLCCMYSAVSCLSIQMVYTRHCGKAVLLMFSKTEIRCYSSRRCCGTGAFRTQISLGQVRLLHAGNIDRMRRYMAPQKAEKIYLMLFTSFDNFGYFVWLFVFKLYFFFGPARQSSVHGIQ